VCRLQAFCSIHFESLQLSAGSTLKLMNFIGEHSTPGKPSCRTRSTVRGAHGLRLAHDMAAKHAVHVLAMRDRRRSFISFLEFLKEKNFLHPLSPAQIEELRQNVQFVNCSNCGASINLESNLPCSLLHSPISMLDMKAAAAYAEQLKQAAEPKPMDPALPMKLASASCNWKPPWPITIAVPNGDRFRLVRPGLGRP